MHPAKRRNKATVVGSTPNSQPRKSISGTSGLLGYFLALSVAIFSFVVFSSALRNNFVNWDDYKNIVENPHYRGLGWTNVCWMFTTFHMGPYQPLLYELPSELALSSFSFVWSYIFTIALLVLGLVLRRRLPWVGIAGLAYLVTSLPVLGIFQNGPQIVAERNSYLACMGWAVLLGASGQYFWQASVDGIVGKRTFVLGSCLTVVLLFGLGVLTWQQSIPLT